MLDKVNVALGNRKDRSAWNKGVTIYAFEILEKLQELVDGGYVQEDSLKDYQALKAAALNGAKDWEQASWGGSFLCYDGQIARRLCNPSELKKTRGGERRPNSKEEWLDVQARALYQAFRRVWSEVSRA